MPYIEFSKTNKDMVWIRVSGAIKFDEDPRKKAKCFERAPGLKAIYQSPENPVFKIFIWSMGRQFGPISRLIRQRLLSFNLRIKETRNASSKLFFRGEFP